MKIRRFNKSDTPQLIELFRETVHTVCRKDYTQEQLNAWAPENIDANRWTIRFEKTFTLVVEHNEHILGFANLQSDGCIDMFYVNASTQSQGIGSRLYEALLDEAKRQGLRALHSDVSLTARQFFLSKGFTIKKEYKKNVADVDFHNAIMTKDLPIFFNKEASLSYDERNKRLAPIADSMHFLIRLILRELPTKSNVLCVGVGTGAEILSLSQAYPEWTFTGVDPSESMLEVCRQRLEAAGVLQRCKLIQGYVQDVEEGENFDAVLSVLVGHFVKREDRLNFLKSMCDRLRPKGYLVNTEISYDLESKEFPLMFKNWAAVQSLMGATPESLATLPKQMREMLAILPPEETEDLLRQSGITLPVRFFQAFMICGWYGNKT